jgi:glyoxylase-like metal-dependent hydrolase (beta-lactamase superfamily II)
LHFEFIYAILWWLITSQKRFEISSILANPNGVGRLRMIQKERIADNVYSFQSDVYAQVNAGAVIGPNWAVLIDTLALPEETRAIRDFLEQEISVPVRYVINTHSHADHAWGNSFFPGATIISYRLCREYLDTIGRESFDEAKKSNLMYQNVEIVLPQVTFEVGQLGLRVGKKILSVIHLPGHSNDNVGVLIEDDRILFAGDAAMSVPYIVDGDYYQMIETLKTIGTYSLENIVQGHGDIVLRGEIEHYIDDNLTYLAEIRKVVRKSARRKYPREILDESMVSDCGKSRVLIGGLAPDLHHRNLIALYQQLYEEIPAAPEEEYY